MNIIRNLTLAAVLTAAAASMAGSYTVSGTAATFGNVSLPSTFSGTLTTAPSMTDGIWDSFTFTPTAGGTCTVSVSPSLQFGETHTIRTQVFKGTIDQIANISGSGSASVTLTKGQYCTIKVQIISPSYYTTTKYAYTVTVGGVSEGGSGAGSGSGSGSSAKLEPPTPAASQGKYKYVKLTWTAVKGCKGYVIKRGTSSNYSSAIQLTKLSSASKKSYNDTSAKVGTTYYYWVCPLVDKTTFWYNSSRYASGYVKGTASGGSSGGGTGGAYISGNGSVKFKSGSTTSAYYLYVGGKKVTSGVTWSKSGLGVSLVKSGGGVKIKMTTKPSGDKNYITLKAKYKNAYYSKSVYIYK